MRIVYITAQIPWGKGENFIFSEIEELQRIGHSISVIPLRPSRAAVLGKEMQTLSQISIYLPLLGIKTLGLAFLAFLRHPFTTVSIFWSIMRTSSFIKFLKNTIIFPKGLAMAYIIKNIKPDHIHAHWASTSSTAAYIAANYTKIPWSLTAHRWDIEENNMLREKAKNAKFIRVISQNGLNKIHQIVGVPYKNKCIIIHMGIYLSKFNSTSDDFISKASSEKFKIICPANLIPVKGHSYLIDACYHLVKKDYSFVCWFIGDGPEKSNLQAQVKAKGLDNIIEFKGQWAHDTLLKLYQQSEVDVVVLPSITTENGEHEGIPVSLMEAMAAQIPVISTNTGGISELLEGNAGLLIPEKDVQALVNALETIINDESLRYKLGESGRRRVEKEFNMQEIVKKLVKKFNDWE